MSRSSVRKARPDADNQARTASRGEVTIHGVLPTASDLWSQVPRTGRWSRVAQCAPVRFAIGLLFLVPGATLETFGSLKASGWLRGAAACLAVLVYAASLQAFARWVERRRPLELSTRGGALEWVIGLALGAALLGATL